MFSEKKCIFLRLFRTDDEDGGFEGLGCYL